MKLIELTNGKIAKVDDQDFEWLSKYKWYYSEAHGAFSNLDGNTFKAGSSMHRLILNAPQFLKVDHKNGDRLDNRRKNIRLCTHADNMRNRKVNKNTRSGFKGVRPNGTKWQAYLMFNRKFIALGQFKTKEQAANAYNEAAKVYFGQFARLNEL